MNHLAVLIAVVAVPSPALSPQLKEGPRVIQRELARSPDLSRRAGPGRSGFVAKLEAVEDARITVSVPLSERQIATLEKMRTERVYDVELWRDGVLFKNSLIRNFRVAEVAPAECEGCEGSALRGPAEEALKPLVNEWVELRLAKSLLGRWVVVGVSKARAPQ